MAENDPDTNKMHVEKIEGGLTEVRKGFAELRASDINQMDAMYAMNTAMFILEQKFADVKKVF